MLAVGKTVDESLRWLCIHNNFGNPISVSDELSEQFTQVTAEVLRRVRKTRAFLRSQAKIKQERMPNKSARWAKKRRT
jgi:hypothetical protein